MLPAKPDTSTVLEQVVIHGDLSKLSAADRVQYYRRVCESLGLNPYTQPFQYITLNGRLTLYARKDATDQLRKQHGISIAKPDVRFEDDWIIVTVEARNADGRTDADIGVVSRKDMRGDFGNALMKCVTKAKRRVTLSICGLGMLDETEVETIPDAKPGPPVVIEPAEPTPIRRAVTRETAEEVSAEVFPPAVDTQDDESRRADLLLALRELAAQKGDDGWERICRWWPGHFTGTPDTASVADLEAAYLKLTAKR